MGRKNLLNSNVNDLNISLTAYRALLVLGMLMEKPMTRDEIASVFQSNHLICKSSSLDTVRVTINTLKAAGCMISRPTSKNDYKYILLSHPFRIEISDEQIEAMNQIRNNLVQLGDWQLILDINAFYNSVVSKTQNYAKMELVKNAEPLLEIDKTILKNLSDKSVKSREIVIDYDSPEFGLEELKIIGDRIFYEDGKLYLWCYSYKYNSYSYIRVDKIKAIKSISMISKSIDKDSYTAIYKLRGDSISTFSLEHNEHILEEKDSEILVEADVLNEFKFIQRLLSFGIDFEIITPDSLKTKLISKLNSVKQGYYL